MTRVLRIITTLDPRLGGPSHSAVNAAVAEQSNETTTTVIVSTRGPKTLPHTPAPLVEAGIEHHEFSRVPFGGERAERWGLSAGFAAWILRHAGAYDVIHVHYVWSVGTVCGVLAGLVWRKPVVMTPHESLTQFDIVTSRTRMRELQKRALRRLLLAGVDCVVVASELERDNSGIQRNRSTVAPHPVVDEHRGTRTGSGKTAEKDDGTPTIGYLGRFHAKKRVDLLLDAFERLAPGARLLIGGDHPKEERDRLRSRVLASGYADRIEFAGFVPTQARDAFFARLDVLVMPSTYECFGMVAAEAMSAGVPVVVSSQTGVASIVTRYQAGIVVPVDDLAALVAALRRVSESSSDLKRMAENAKRAAAEMFSVEAYEQSITRVYDDVTG